MDAMDEICAVVGYIGSYGFLDPILLFLVLFMMLSSGFLVRFLSSQAFVKPKYHGISICIATSSNIEL